MQERRNTPSDTRGEDRRERLANELRSNLQKRKALARARRRHTEAPSDQDSSDPEAN